MFHVLQWDLHARPGCKVLDGVDETHALEFHEEADGRSMGAAAEAVIKLFAGADRERGRFLIVERAACRIIPPHLAQRDIRVDDRDNVDPGH